MGYSKKKKDGSGKVMCLNIPIIINKGKEWKLNKKEQKEYNKKYDLLYDTFNNSRQISNKCLREISYVKHENAKLEIEFENGFIKKYTSIGGYLYGFIVTTEKDNNFSSYSNRRLANYCADSWETVRKKGGASIQIKNPIIPLAKEAISILETVPRDPEKGKYSIDQYIFRLKAFKATEDYPHNFLDFRSIISVKDAYKYDLLKDKILTGKYPICGSQITRKKNSGLFLDLSYIQPEKKSCLNPEIVMGVDLGVNIPVVCALKGTDWTYKIGWAEAFTAGRSKYRAVRRKKQKIYGNKAKFRQQTAEEKRWAKQIMHKITNDTINRALMWNAGTVHIEDLSGIKNRMIKQQKDSNEIPELSDLKRVVFMTYEFKRQLKYKAALHGIKVIEINPRNTSRRCSKCGNIDKNNRQPKKNQAYFKCTECGFQANADANAAINIAEATGKVITEGYK